METALSSPIITNAREGAASISVGGSHPGREHDWVSEEATQTAERPTSLPVDEQQETLPRASKRKRLTVYLPVSLLERLRNTVYWTRGTTVAGLLEAALTESLDQKEHQRGGPFPRRLEELKGGRPKRRRLDPVQE